MQLEHHNSIFKKKTFPLVLICDHISNSSNVGGLIRLADAFGLKAIYFLGSDTPMGHKARKASRSAEKYVDVQLGVNVDELLLELGEENYAFYGLEITKNSQEIRELNINEGSKVALIIGNEQNGITDKLLEKCKAVFHIELYGNNSSINVTTASAVALKALTDQLKSIS